MYLGTYSWDVVLQTASRPGCFRGGDLRLKLIVESFQCLLLAVGIFAVESCLLPIVI